MKKCKICEAENSILQAINDMCKSASFEDASHYAKQNKIMASPSGIEAHYKRHILNKSISNDLIPNDSIPNGSVTNGSVTNGSVTNGSVTNGSVTNGSVPNGSVQNYLVQNDSVQSNTDILNVQKNLSLIIQIAQQELINYKNDPSGKKPHPQKTIDTWYKLEKIYEGRIKIKDTKEQLEREMLGVTIYMPQLQEYE